MQTVSRYDPPRNGTSYQVRHPGEPIETRYGAGGNDALRFEFLNRAEYLIWSANKDLLFRGVGPSTATREAEARGRLAQARFWIDKARARRVNGAGSRLPR